MRAISFPAIGFGIITALLALLADPWFAVVAIAALSTVWWLLYRPQLSLLLFAFSATFLPFSTVNVGIRITLCELMLALCWLSMLPTLLRQPHYLRLTAVHTALLAFVAWSILPLLAGEISVKAEGKSLVSWLRYLLTLSPVVLIPMLITQRQQAKNLLYAIAAGTTLMLLLSLAIFIAKGGNPQPMMDLLAKLRYANNDAVENIFTGTGKRLASPWVHPNMLGGFLAFIVPVLFLLALDETRKHQQRFLYAVAALAAVGLLLSGSRGAILSLFIIALWLAWRRVRATSKLIVAGLLLGIVLATSYAPLRDRLSTMFSSSNASTEVRGEEYRNFPRAVERYPLGIGFKTDPPADRDLMGISNLWLNYMYKLGLPGMLLFIWISWRWWRLTRPGPRNEASDPLQLGLVAGLLTAQMTGFFDHYFSFSPVLTTVFWMLTGLSIVLARDPDLTTRHLQRDTELKPQE